MTLQNIKDVLSDKETAINFYKEIPRDTTAFYSNRGHWIAYKYNQPHDDKKANPHKWVRYLNKWIPTNIQDMGAHVDKVGIGYLEGMHAIIKSYPLETIGLINCSRILFNKPNGATYYNHIGHKYYQVIDGRLHLYTQSNDHGDCWDCDSYHDVSYAEDYFIDLKELSDRHDIRQYYQSMHLEQIVI